MQGGLGVPGPPSSYDKPPPQAPPGSGDEPFHGVFKRDDQEGFWVDVNHTSGGVPSWEHVRSGEDDDMSKVMQYLGFPDPVVRAAANEAAPAAPAAAAEAAGGGGEKLSALLFSNLRSFCESLTDDNSVFIRDKILPAIAPGKESINILHIVTAPLSASMINQSDEALRKLCRGVATASETLRQFFSGVFLDYDAQPLERGVKVFHLHLYDPDSQPDERLIDEFAGSCGEDVSEAETVLHLLGWMKADGQDDGGKYDGNIEAQQEQLVSILTDNDINTVFCAGGETHWLRARLAAAGCLDLESSALLARKNELVWSGFSAGSIIMGSTTKLCASKNFSPLTNPERLYPHPEFDDIGMLLAEGNNGPCAFPRDGSVPTEPPPDCEYGGLGIVDATVVPHYDYGRFEALIQKDDRVFRICDPMCYAIHLVPDDPLSVVSNKPYDEDTLAASSLTQASYPQLNFQIVGDFYSEENLKEAQDQISNLTLIIKELLATLRGINDWLRKLDQDVVDIHEAMFEGALENRDALYTNTDDKTNRERIEYLVFELGVMKRGIETQIMEHRGWLDAVLNEDREVVQLISRVCSEIYVSDPNPFRVSIDWMRGFKVSTGKYTDGVDVVRWAVKAGTLNVHIAAHYDYYNATITKRNPSQVVQGVWDDVIKLVAEKMRIIKVILVDGKPLTFVGEPTEGGSGGQIASLLAAAASGLATLAALLAA